MYVWILIVNEWKSIWPISNFWVVAWGNVLDLNGNSLIIKDAEISGRREEDHDEKRGRHSHDLVQQLSSKGKDSL